jgi:hypothetical protein
VADRQARRAVIMCWALRNPASANLPPAKRLSDDLSTHSGIPAIGRVVRIMVRGKSAWGMPISSPSSIWKGDIRGKV